MKQRIRVGVLAVLLWVGFAAPAKVDAAYLWGFCLNEPWGIDTCDELIMNADNICMAYFGTGWDPWSGWTCIEDINGPEDPCLSFQFFCFPVND